MNIRVFKRFLFCFFLFCSLRAQHIPFKLGVENISATLLTTICPQKKKELCIIGLITNQTGVDQKGTRTIDTLLHQGFKVQYMFVPEHGLNSTLAGHDVHDSVDKKTKIPIISLYKSGVGKMISSDHMNNLDCLFFDIQDSGMRHYTYISTLLNSMKIAAEYGKPFVVLDRPNPLGCAMEGPLVDSDLISFISIAPIPLRHGMTIGELAHYFNAHVLEKPISLSVVRMKGYDRCQGFMGPFVHQLSPNLRSLQSCYGYSFLGLLGEVEPFDVGVGTSMAFRCITLPEKMNVIPAVWKRLQQLLNSFGVKSHLYHHTNPKNHRNSKGLRLEFSRISQLRSFELFIAIVQFFKQENIPFSFSAAFDKSVGTRKVQEVIMGTLPQDLFFEQIKSNLHQFYERAKSSFLYVSGQKAIQQSLSSQQPVIP
jgi:uncharacterized protein YbbC (DUF1343 family)